MNLHIHIWTNLEYFELLNKWKLLSQWKQDRDLASFFMQNFPGELGEDISPQYEINFMWIREIKKRFWPKAIDLFRQFNKNFPPHEVRTFTLVTPYVGNTMLTKLEETLDFLNNLNIKNPIEIVVNDFGVLRLLEKKYTNLTPIFGRVIHKILKTPLIDTFGYEAHPAWDKIQNKTEQEKLALRDEIVKWQMKFYNSSEVSLDVFQNFLKKYWVTRVALDYMEKREELFDNSRFWDIWIDLYYPWALIFTGRLCDTSAIENPSRWYYATDDICPRTCNKFDVSYKIKTVGYKMIQRWNAGYRSEINLDFLSENFAKNKANRLVFAPFITV